MPMKIELYVKGNELLSKITNQGVSKNCSSASTWKFMEKLQSEKIQGIKNENNVISFSVDDLLIKIYDYKKLKNIDYFRIVEQALNEKTHDDRIKAQLIKSKKRRINRRRSLAIGTCLVIIGTSVFLPKAFKKPAIVPQEVPSITQETDKIDDYTVNQNNSDEKDIIFSPTIPEVINEANYYLDFNYTDRSTTEKALITKNSYGELITKYANTYGIDPNLMIALATQERGVHSTTIDNGGATGLMQLQNSVWVGHSITAYNYETNSYDTLAITEDNIGDLETNIKAGCMIFWKCLDYMDYNPIAALQCYNYGYGNMETVLNSYAEENYISKKEVLQNISDLSWLNNRNLIYVGDSNYVENVLSWLGENVNLNFKSKDSDDIIINVSNENQNVRM